MKHTGYNAHHRFRADWASIEGWAWTLLGIALGITILACTGHLKFLENL